MDYTEEAKCESLVMGSRGLGLGKRALLGVSQGLSQRRGVVPDMSHSVRAGQVGVTRQCTVLCCAVPLHVVLMSPDHIGCCTS